MPFYKVHISKEMTSELHILANSKEDIQKLEDGQLEDLCFDQLSSSDWEKSCWVTIDHIEEIEEKEFSQYINTDLEEFLK